MALKNLLKHAPIPYELALAEEMVDRLTPVAGASQMTATSNLGLIVIYQAKGEGSDSKKSLIQTLYFSRLTQAFIMALSSQMAEGQLYEVDMRLRPISRAGVINMVRDKAGTIANVRDLRRRLTDAKGKKQGSGTLKIGAEACLVSNFSRSCSPYYWANLCRTVPRVN